jgi:hypothetical protein
MENFMSRDSFGDRFGRGHSREVESFFSHREGLWGRDQAERDTSRALSDATFGRGPLAGRTGSPFKDDPFFNPWAKGGSFDRSANTTHFDDDHNTPPRSAHFNDAGPASLKRTLDAAVDRPGKPPISLTQIAIMRAEEEIRRFIDQKANDALASIKSDFRQCRKNLDDGFKKIEAMPMQSTTCTESFKAAVDHVMPDYPYFVKNDSGLGFKPPL